MRIMQDRTPDEFNAFRTCLKANKRQFKECRESQEALHAAYAAIGGFNTRAPLASEATDA
jgi:hypothetical protein